VALAGYSPCLAWGPGPLQEAGSSKPGTAVPCVGSLSDYCKRTGGKCPGYAESVKGLQRCQRPNAAIAHAEHCKGVYRSLSWRQPTLLFGSDEYFDVHGRLIAAYQISDALDAFCNRSSPSQTFGTIPTCPTAPIVTNLCRK